MEDGSREYWSRQRAFCDGETPAGANLVSSMERASRVAGKVLEKAFLSVAINHLHSLSSNRSAIDGTSIPIDKLFVEGFPVIVHCARSLCQRASQMRPPSSVRNQRLSFNGYIVDSFG